MLLRLLKYPFASVRSRAMAAGFLDPGSLRDLAALSSRGEASAALEGRLPAVAGRPLEVESRARLDFLRLGSSIGRALPSAGRRVVLAYLRRVELENLKTLGRGLLQGRQPEAFHSRLLPHRQSGSLPLDALLQVRDFDALAAALARTPWHKALRLAREAPPERRPLLLELMLERIFWDGVRQSLQELDGGDRAGAGELLNLRADLDRFNVAHRGWRAGLAEQELLDALPAMGTAFPEPQVRRALRSDDPEAALARLFPDKGIDSPLSPAGEVALSRRLHRRLRQALRSHPLDLSVSLAALLLKEQEVRDLQAVLSGLRLGRQKEEIVPCLACVGG
jgi:vacuolar-type H+-ATPase subunit C/Vma6